MDVQGLQGALRQFAGDRKWEAFHTPKNLAMALIVEAAELAEIFQWMTPEESCDAHRDPAIKQHIGEELADVLLYLLQVADHTDTDLEQAVRDKLVRNAQKYPQAWKANLDKPATAVRPAIHVLLDYENVQPTESELRALVPEATNVWVFHGPHQKLVEKRFSSYGDAVTAVPISKTGKNALDFHLSFYMGYITSRNQAADVVVVANDNGYEPVLEHVKAMGFAVRRHGNLRPVTDVPVAPTRTLVKKKAAAKKTAAITATPARKAAAKKAVAKKQPPSVAKKAAKTTVAKVAVSKVPVVKTASPADLAKRVLEGLRKMGSKRPVKVTSLKRALKSLLGTSASDEAVATAFNNLVASGEVTVGASGSVAYPSFA